MLKRFKLSHLLLTSFSLISALILIISLMGYSSTKELKGILDYISGPAWDTADGAMEGAIGIEKQMLSMENYLDDINNSKALEKFEAALAIEKESLDRMSNTGQINSESIEQLNLARANFRQASEKLQEDYRQFTESEIQRHQTYEVLLKSLDEIEALGDGYVDVFAEQPDSLVSWNSGLNKAWTMADGIMEYRILMLTRGGYYQALLRTKDFAKYLPLIKEPLTDINAILEELGITQGQPITEDLDNYKIQSGALAGQTFAETLMNGTKQNVSTFDNAISKLKALENSYKDYQAASEELLETIEHVKDLADGKVFNAIDVVDDIFAEITAKLIVAVVIALLLSIAVSFLIIRLVLNNTKDAKNLAHSISSGNLSNQIQGSSKTEFGSLMLELSAMQDSLKQSRDEMQSHLNESKLIVDALDNASANVIIANNDEKVVFVNQQMKQLVDANRNEFASKIKGLQNDGKIEETDIFKQLKISCQTTQQTIHIGSLTIELSSQAIHNVQQELIGYFTEWKNVTHTLAIEQQVKQLIAAASQGKLDQRLDTDHLDGFLLELGNGINSMMQNIQHSLKSFITAASQLSEGDLTAHVDQKLEGELKIFKDSLNQATANIASLVSDILQTADQVNTTANNIMSANREVNQITQANAASVEQTAASLEQMTSSLKQSADFTKQVNDSSTGTVNKAQSNTQVVEQSVAAMHSIKEVSVKIDGITNLIDSIAFQTNLLALNAAVEAARAGEHGRGFAVVAGEVRNLAQKSAEAAKEIKQLVAEVNTKVESGTNLVETTSTVMADIINEIQNVGGMIEEIAKSSNEQEKGILQVNQAVSTFDTSTQKTAAMIDDTSASSQELNRMVEELRDKLQQFKLPNQLTHLD
ncbi:methyl-accepting chemotaxis protein [Thiomicrorhabdus sediminis]|nr:methyl-accepting chemotaxis protein [Thiomicrorhabdus sediminis]